MSVRHSIQVIPKANVSSHLASLFKTEHMQTIARDVKSPVKRLCERIARGPLFTFTPPDFGVDPAAETNFTSWYKLLAVRNKPNSHPMMEDMYLLHEYYHLANMPYFHEECDFVAWREKMLSNEQQASFYSEAWIYHLHPHLRQELPIADIWADRFTFEQFQYDAYTDFILESNKGTSPHQARAALFDKTNDLWCTEYWPIAHKVESHMANFHQECENQRDEDMIVHDHLDFIDRHYDTLSALAGSYNHKWRQMVGLKSD